MHLRRGQPSCACACQLTTFLIVMDTYKHHENRSLIQSLALMRLAIIPVFITVELIDTSMLSDFLLNHLVLSFPFSNVPRGAFVMEYCGEVISPVQFEERKKQYTIEKRRHYYFMSLRTDEVRARTWRYTVHTVPVMQCSMV